MKCLLLKENTWESSTAHMWDLPVFCPVTLPYIATVLYCPDKKLINSTSVHCEHGRLCLIWWGVSKLKGRINRQQLQRIHGLRTPNEAFFIEKGRQFGQINSGPFGVFSDKLSASILVQWVPCPRFPLFNHYFYKKISLYIHILNIYLGLGFELEFGLQRITDLAFVCP